MGKDRRHVLGRLRLVRCSTGHHRPAEQTCMSPLSAGSYAGGKALPVLWFGGTGTASTTAAGRYGGWLHKQNQTLSQISAREMTRPRTPNTLHLRRCPAVASSHSHTLSTGHITCSSSVCSSILAVVNNVILDLDSKWKESERASRQGLPALATHPWKFKPLLGSLIDCIAVWYTMCFGQSQIGTAKQDDGTGSSCQRTYIRTIVIWQA